MAANPIERLDVPLATVEAEIACRILRDAAARTCSPSDRLAYALDTYLITHPEVCSTAADYPGWTPGGLA